ncbi:MAG: hypothetical protein CVU77_07615 [Elusimicrobia bacterium HGW-Elusimicrobia-1]|nr:MAG: hypothetical protein CVU77_07615 [Elusimicrobia bacterium HGW-Elusimicrobia-1]
MPKKSKTNYQFVTNKEFNETKREFIGKFESIEKNMATKDDIKNMATKDDIKNMATKDDIARLAKEIIRHTEDIEYIKRTMAKNEDIQRIITTLDVLIAKTDEHERKAMVNTYRIQEVESKVDGHEKRISALESQPPTRT